MNMEQKIPIPRAQRWKEFRLRVMPVLVFLAVFAVVVHLWRERVVRANMTGVVVGLAAEVRSPAPGYLVGIETDRFRFVSAGEVIGEVITTDPRLLEARLGVVLAEVDLLRSGGGDAASQQRAMLDREALQIDLMRSRAELASAELARQQAERELERTRALFERDLVPEQLYEQARANLAILVAQVEKTTELVDQMRDRLETMPQGGAAATGALAAAIRLQENALRLIEAESFPAPLVAPFDGMVGRVFRSNGDRVSAEEPILMLRSPHPRYIVGYLPQPVRVQPVVGMPVVIRSPSRGNVEFTGQVVSVGVQIESMDEVELLNAPASSRVMRTSDGTPTLVPTGLPVQVAMGEGSPSLRPGEIVQLTLLPRR